jgi:hypothetical protein
MLDTIQIYHLLYSANFSRLKTASALGLEFEVVSLLEPFSDMRKQPRELLTFVTAAINVSSEMG